MPTIEGKGPALSEQDIATFERRLGAKLPPAYRDFLMQNNGGYPVPDVFHFNGRASKSCVQAFYSLSGPNQGRRFKLVLETYQDRVPGGFLPIGYDPGGNLLCLQLTSPGTGRVYFWDHENEVDEGERPGMQNMTLVAESFEDFLTSLHDLAVRP